jgi:hypothetical protein
MIFSWFDARDAQNFGAAMACFYIERIPASAGFSEKQFASKSKQVLEKMNHQVIDFKLKNKLNIYKTAQLGNAFKWALKDAGYEAAYIDKLTQWLVARLQ